MPKVDYSQRARTAIKDIGLYTIQTWGAAQADAYVSDLLNRIEAAMQWPQAAPKAMFEGRPVRNLIVRHHVAYYTIEPDRILIRAIIHENRMPGTLRDPA
ncbi:type II toxin-antitoxin system RelE/ParE family toxin [Hyphobacterium marinum]|uniref:Type II toxin-antitoxin system RelE/ParE family toxin n=1 Tax=Hyphobacterium marinum TaxID=3116574 RepID=A0ABU7M066_9PROT|nr:type II toxin-antitoxin system RelE/ParE family toxin [Hyphobacterium sp. Y6023]MEE2567178.1 type II toxin-antitoxin system RelE/ParE family toxin [Hyphobacterium sp. Y6023]